MFRDHPAYGAHSLPSLRVYGWVRVSALGETRGPNRARWATVVVLITWSTKLVSENLPNLL